MRRYRPFMAQLAILIILFAAAFLLLDFRAQKAEMAVDSTVETYTFGHGERSGPWPLEQALDLYVQAPRDLEGELVEALSEELSANPYVGDINVQEAPPAAAKDSILVVEIAKPSVAFWSPFYARTVMTVDLAYASDGQVAWMDADTVHLVSGELSEPVFRARGEYSFDGNAYGLISGPGYARYLAEEVAQTVNDSLADHLASKRGS